MDIYWRDTVSCPSEEDYKTMVIRSTYSIGEKPGTIFMKHLRENLKLRENFGTELQQNQRTLPDLFIIVGCKSNSVFKAL